MKFKTRSVRNMSLRYPSEELTTSALPASLIRNYDFGVHVAHFAFYDQHSKDDETHLLIFTHF